MTKLEKAKEIIKKYFKDADLGIFDSRNLVGDWMTNIYDDGNLVIDICYPYNYFEVFGLSDEEFNNLTKYYNSLTTNTEFDKIESIPPADVRPVVTCSECIYAPSGDGQGFDLEWPHDEWPENNPCPWKCEDGWYSHKPRPDFFCANGKKEG